MDDSRQTYQPASQPLTVQVQETSLNEDFLTEALLQGLGVHRKSATATSSHPREDNVTGNNSPQRPPGCQLVITRPRRPHRETVWLSFCGGCFVWPVMSRLCVRRSQKCSIRS